MRAESLHALLLIALVVGLGFSVFAYAESVDVSLQHDCSVNPFFSCAKIDESGLTHTLGVPDYAWGIGGFVLLLALDVPLYITWRPSLLHALTLVAAAGGAFSLYLAYIELVLIRGLCPVCLGAYLMNATALGCALVLEWKRRPAAAEPDEPAPDEGAAGPPTR